MLLQNLARDTMFYHQPYYEYTNIINLLINHYYYLLQQKKIELILWNDIPHGTFSLIMYFLAQALGIKSIILQSMYGEMEGRIAYSYTIEEMGTKKELPIFENKIGDMVHSTEGYKKELSYMSAEKIKYEMGRGKNRRLKAIIHPKSWWEERKKIYAESFKKYHDFDEFIQKKILQKMNQYFVKKRFKKNASKNLYINADLNKRFVYFPLHLQPEMTTDVLGGMYADQLLAIEKLRHMLPDDVLIYVKENPKQKEYMREQYFFQRLNTIPGTCLISRDIDTYTLMEHALFVATITGTAGWEAISGGKPVLIFGNVWYQNFPGVFRYSDALKWQDIVNANIKREAVEKAFQELQKYTFPGVYLEDIAQDMDEKFDYEINRQHLYIGLRFLINQ